MSRAMQVIQHRANLSPLPGLDLLDLPDPSRKVSYTAEQLERLSKLLEIKLQEFNVKATVVEAQPGPVVTRFELELAAGVKASKVTNISRDLARSMSMATRPSPTAAGWRATRSATPSAPVRTSGVSNCPRPITNRSSTSWNSAAEPVHQGLTGETQY